MLVVAIVFLHPEKKKKKSGYAFLARCPTLRSVIIHMASETPTPLFSRTRPSVFPLRTRETPTGRRLFHALPSESGAVRRLPLAADIRRRSLDREHLFDDDIAVVVVVFRAHL